MGVLGRGSHKAEQLYSLFLVLLVLCYKGLISKVTAKLTLNGIRLIYSLNFLGFPRLFEALIAKALEVHLLFLSRLHKAYQPELPNLLRLFSSSSQLLY